jgi:hypothetical protein
MEAKHPPQQQSHIDRVLAESKRLRTEMLRTAEELKGFADDLMEAARLLKSETARLPAPPDSGSTTDAGA